MIFITDRIVRIVKKSQTNVGKCQNLSKTSGHCAPPNPMFMLKGKMEFFVFQDGHNSFAVDSILMTFDNCPSDQFDQICQNQKYVRSSVFFFDYTV